MERFILHSDFNAFYASVECMLRPSIKHLPVAVAGDPKKRHGIILAKNDLAKKSGVKTAEAIWQARQKCPGLLVIQPTYGVYEKISHEAFEIYKQYTPKVESFGLDECWLDISKPGMTMESATSTAHEIRERMKRTFGITVSVGVSTNKVFAKLASDLKKPDAVSVISPENYRTVAWELPANALLFVGPATNRTLMRYGIKTIGDIAKAQPEFMKMILGKSGLVLHRYANGEDNSPVADFCASTEIKSIGNSTTTPVDLHTDDEIYATFVRLADKVGGRLRNEGFRAGGIQITVRDKSLFTYERQEILEFPTNITLELAKSAMALYSVNRLQGENIAVRSLGIRAISLVSAGIPAQASLFEDIQKRDGLEKLDRAIDNLRSKFGADTTLWGFGFRVH